MLQRRLWPLSLQAGFRGGAAGRPARTTPQQQHINLIVPSFFGEQHRREQWLIKGLQKLSLCQICPFSHLWCLSGGLWSHRYTGQKFPGAPEFLFLLIYTIIIQQLFPLPSFWSAIRKTYRHVTIVKRTHLSNGFAASGNRWHDRNVSILVSSLWKQKTYLPLFGFSLLAPSCFFKSTMW